VTRVLYEDNQIIVVFKPAGMLVQSDASGEPTLMDFAKNWIAEKYAKPGKVFLGLVHRIDRRVQGLVVFGRTSKGAARLSEQIRTRAIEKTYRAWIEGDIAGESGELTHWLSQNDGYVTAHDSAGEGRKEARLGWKVLRRTSRTTLLEIDLHTGRKHQIRIQLARIGHPILGDDRYGGKSQWPPPGIALISFRLRFKHPTRDEMLAFEVPPELDSVSPRTGE
jgi:23S rRNA pseudouridine1911/1915/1917 synthase